MIHEAMGIATYKYVEKSRQIRRMTLDLTTPDTACRPQVACLSAPSKARKLMAPRLGSQGSMNAQGTVVLEGVDTES